MTSLTFQSSPASLSGWKSKAAVGLIAGFALSAVPEAGAATFASIASTSTFNVESGNYDYSYTFSFKIEGLNYLTSQSFAIPLFDPGSVTSIATPANWSFSIVAGNASYWGFYNPALDPKAGTYGAPASAFLEANIPQLLVFTTNTPVNTGELIQGPFTFQSLYAGTQAPFVASFTTEGPGDTMLIGDPLVPNSPNFPVPEPGSAALLLTAGTLIGFTRRRS